VSDDGHVVRAVALTQTVVVEVDVEDPTEAVFDAPSGADGFGRLR